MSTEVTEATQREQSRKASFDSSRLAGPQPTGVPPELNVLSGRIIGAAMEVHTHLGAGLREKLYEAALVHELRRMGLRVDQQIPFNAIYKGVELPAQVIDTIVERRVILKFKSVRQVVDEDHAQLIGYLRLTGLPLGLLPTFGQAHLRDGIFRKINFPPHVSPELHLKPSPVFSTFSSVPSVSPQ